MTAGRFWDRFLVPGGDLARGAVPIPCVLVLALSFGYVDDLGRAVYSTETNNYANAFDPIYIPVLLRSVFYAALTTLLCFAIGYPVAYYIARYGGRYRNALIALLVLPFFVNYLVRTYAWVALLSDEGLVNNSADRHRPDQRADPDDQHAVRGDRRPHLRLPGLHDPAGLRRRSSASTGR